MPSNFFLLLFQVTKDNLDAVLQQQIMDQFRKDNEALQENLEQRKLKSLADTKVTTRNYVYNALHISKSRLS